MKDEVVAVIPARYFSSRLPGKPLADIAGRPMIVRVAERARRARLVSRVIIASDDIRIISAAQSAGFEAALTSAAHTTGTDRIAEVARNLSENIIVNVQGDEPLLSPATIDAAVEPLIFDRELQMSTTCEPIESAHDLLDPNAVKVVVDASGNALYFSRSPIPFPRDSASRYGSLPEALTAQPELLNACNRHTGLYAYRRDFLLQFASMPRSPLEKLESLEQLRALEAGVRIRVVRCTERSLGVDTPEDLERARRLFQ